VKAEVILGRELRNDGQTRGKNDEATWEDSGMESENNNKTGKGGNENSLQCN
jgi:hypothetical protein